MAATRSIRVRESTGKRLEDLAQTLGQPRSDVIERALDAIERELFWEGWDEEASAFLQQHGEAEQAERSAFAGTNADGSHA